MKTGPLLLQGIQLGEFPIISFFPCYTPLGCGVRE